MTMRKFLAFLLISFSDYRTLFGGRRSQQQEIVKVNVRALNCVRILNNVYVMLEQEGSCGDAESGM